VVRDTWVDLLSFKHKKLSATEYDNFHIAALSLAEHEKYIGMLKETLKEILESNPDKRAKSCLVKDLVDITGKLPGATVNLG
jgi:hypothetical protein